LIKLDGMNNHIMTTSPNRYARIGGIAYLIIIAAGLFGEMFVRNAIIIPGNAAGSASNIMASPLLWRMGIAGDLIMHMCDIVLMLMLYVLLKPVNRNLALLVILFNLIQTAVLVANKLNLLMPLFLLQDADYLKAFTPEQLHALAYVSVRAHSYGFGIGLIFFGAVCLVEGYLIYASDFLPKVIGIMMQIAGACYLINSFALILAPKVASMLFPAIMIPSFIGELSLCLWLIIKGVNVEKWKERAIAMK
jgi:hypothetical protein